MDCESPLKKGGGQNLLWGQCLFDPIELVYLNGYNK